jgi:hypothetical protein
MATSLRHHVPFSLQSNPRGATQAPGAGKLDTCAMERVALLRTSGRRLLHRCRRGRPVVQAAAVSSSARRLPATSFPSRGYSALPGGARFLSAAAPLHCAGRYWPAAAPRLARRLSVPAVSTSPSPVPQGENCFCWNSENKGSMRRFTCNFRSSYWIAGRCIVDYLIENTDVKLAL